MFNIECKDCKEGFTSTSQYKQLCPNCLKQHNREATRKSRQTSKGKHYVKLYNLSYRANSKIPCPKCGKPMCPKSKLCYICSDKGRRGENHPSWKGGRYEARGYIFIHKPDYPRAECHGYVLEHIFIWETYHKKLLPKGWEVHHYNGIKNDNRPANLFAQSKREHRLIIPELQKRIQNLEALLNNQYQLL